MLTSWLLASAAVLIAWLLGSIADQSGVAYGQTVPGAPQAISTTAGTVAKRRPQLAANAAGGIYMVWEEGATGTNNSNLYYAYRDPGSGNWTAPGIVVDPATVNYAGRWGAVGVLVNETHAHIQVDPSGNLHVVYAAERIGAIGKGAYYTVGNAADPTALNWSDPVRLDYVSYTATPGYLLNLDNTRLFVGNAIAGGYTSVGYVLWTGNSGNQLRLTRVGYGPGGVHGPVIPLDAVPVSNPVNTSVGPVAVLEIDGVTLRLVYAGANLQTGNGFWAAPLDLTGGGTPTWGARASVAGTNGNDCSVAGCTGASATHDNVGNVWIAANYDVGTAHQVQATAHDGTPAAPPVLSELVADPPKAGRQPVVVFDVTAPVVNAVMVYNQCTYSSASSCPSKDVYYRVHTAGSWGPANLTGATTGEQQDLTAIMVGDDLYYAWVGVNQAGAGTGQQAYFHWVAAP